MIEARALLNSVARASLPSRQYLFLIFMVLDNKEQILALYISLSCNRLLLKQNNHDGVHTQQ